MKILIDADGCPVVDFVVKTAKKYEIECVIVCDTSHEFSIDGVKTVTVSKGADSADFKIINMVNFGDIVVTQDYGLAAMCLSKRVFAINQNGIIFDNSNIDGLLLQRYDCKKRIANGKRVKGPKKRSMQNDEKFREAFINLVKGAVKNVQ